MYKLNLVLIVLTCLIVFGGATYLALGPGEAVSASPTVEDLIRDLGDSDPDVRKEARKRLIDSGEEGVQALQRASKSKRRILASRARRLLAKIGVPPQREVETEVSSREIPAPALPEGVVIEIFPATNGHVYVSLVNHRSVPVLIARERRGEEIDYGRFGWFEGDFVSKLGDCLPKLSVVEWMVVDPGRSVQVFSGIPFSEGVTGLYRFVYDASEESDYRKSFRSSELGAPLFPERIVSRWVEVPSPGN